MSALAAALVLGLAPGTPQVRYHLRYEPEAPPRWVVEMKARGIDPEVGPLRLHLEDWGEWTEVDSLYLPLLECDPPAAPVEGEPDLWELELPADWRGTISLRYALHPTRLGSRAQEEHGLLPWFTGDHSFGFSQNILLRVVRPGKVLLEAETTLELEAPAGWKTATGLTGLGGRRQELALPHENLNTVLAFGAPRHVARGRGETCDYEVVQFGPEHDVTGATLRDLEALVPLYGRTSGRAMRRTVRVFVTERGLGGIRTDGSLGIGFRDDIAGYEDSPYFRQTLAHEAFHDWLGGFLRAEGDSLQWFFEGFTDYLALWHATTAGVHERAWFCERLMELDAELRANERWGETRFGDPEVRWREEANEEVAYKGGAVLALAIDAELRAAGGPGLMQLVADLLEQNAGRYSRESIRAWMLANGLEELHRLAIEGTALPAARESLARLGLEPGAAPGASGETWSTESEAAQRFFRAEAPR